MPCVSWFLFSAGCTNENRTKIENSSITKIVNDVTQTSQQSISNLGNNWQSLDVVNKGVGSIIRCPNLNFNQNLNATMKIINSIDSNQASQIKNQLREQMVNDVKTMASNNPNLWQSLFGKAVSQSNITEVTNKLEAEFNNSVNQETIQNVINSSLNKQDLKIYNEGTIEGQLCNFGQNMIVDFQANNLLKNVQNSLLTNDVFKEIQNNLETVSKSGGDGDGKKGGKKKKKKVWWIIILVLALLFLAIWIYSKVKSPQAGVSTQKVQVEVAAAAPAPAAPSVRK